MNLRKEAKIYITVGSAFVIQTAPAAAPNTFLLTRRCFHGRNVACVRSKEVAARFVIDARGKKT